MIESKKEELYLFDIIDVEANFWSIKLEKQFSKEYHVTELHEVKCPRKFNSYNSAINMKIPITITKNHNFNWKTTLLNVELLGFQI